MITSRTPYGKEKLTLVDRLGVFLSMLAIRKHLPSHQTLQVLELGCGYHAKLLRAIAPHIKNGIGVDFSINPQLNTTHSNLQFIEAPIEEAWPQLIHFTPQVIMLISVLEHLCDPAQILTACYQLLPAKGKMLINVPTWRGKTFLEFSAFKLGTSPKAEMDDHKMYYDKRDLWPLLIKAGFKPSQVKLHYHKFGLNLFAIAEKV